MNKRFSPMKWAKAKTEMAIIFSSEYMGGKMLTNYRLFFDRMIWSFLSKEYVWCNFNF